MGYGGDIHRRQWRHSRQVGGCSEKGRRKVDGKENLGGAGGKPTPPCSVSKRHRGAGNRPDRRKSESSTLDGAAKARETSGKAITGGRAVSDSATSAYLLREHPCRPREKRVRAPIKREDDLRAGNEGDRSSSEEENDAAMPLIRTLPAGKHSLRLIRTRNAHPLRRKATSSGERRNLPQQEMGWPRARIRDSE